MTRRERLERKAELRHQWAESRAHKAETEWDKADLSEAKSGIPLGQPILIGHHSEARHRRVIERADNAMRRAVEHSNMSKEHERKAGGIENQLDRSIFSDDADAIEQLEARIAANEAEREKNNQINKIVRKKPRAQETPEKIAALAALGISEPVAHKLFESLPGYGKGIASYVNRNLSGRIKADRDRLSRIRKQRENAQAARETQNGVLVKPYGEDYYIVTFAEKPERSILNALKSAGYYWNGGSWVGKRDALPDVVKDTAYVRNE